MNHAIDPALRRLVIAHGGDGRWRACPGSDGAVRVWAIRRPSGTVFLKSYPHGRGFRQELTALRDWGPALAGVPRILAVQAALLVIAWRLKDRGFFRQVVDLLESRQDLDPTAYAEFAERWTSLGATIVGGCCEVGPAHIAELARRLKTSGARLADV